VAVLIRQTARYPIACLSDGLAFRNSVLAGFATPSVPAEALVAWLNAWPVRYLHYTTTRDARQGMPQLKIGHLRALPAPPPDRIEALATLGAKLSAANAEPDARDLAALDRVVGDAFALDASERAAIATFARTVR
jgi:hypothetical protein